MTRCYFHNIIMPRGRTVVFRIASPLSGCGLRVSLSNRYGTRSYVIRGMTVKVGGQIYDIRYKGEKRIRIPRSTVLCSDEIDVSLCRGDEIEVRFIPATRAVDVNFIEENTVPHSGDRLHADVLPEYTYSRFIDKFQFYRLLPIIDGIEIKRECRARKIVAFGDSITALSRWTKPLSKRLCETYGEQYVLLNAGISGNCLTYESNGLIRRAYGPMGIKRFADDVLAEGEIHTVIFALGTNDMALMRDKNRTAVNLEKLIDTTRQIFVQLKERGIRIVAANVMPRMGDGTFTVEMETVRLAYNRWLAQCPDIDYLMDWDAVGRDPARPAWLRDGFHMGDHLHPSREGGQELADSIRLSELIGE